MAKRDERKEDFKAKFTGNVPVSMYAMAKHLGISAEHVRRLVNSGVFPVDENRKIPFTDGVEAWQKYSMNLKVPKLSKAAKTGNMPLASKEYVDNKAMFDAAKAQEKVYAAKLKQLEVQRLTRELFAKEEIEMDARELAGEIRGRLLAMPSRVAALCENRTAREIERILGDAVNDIIVAIRGRFLDE